MIFFLCPLWVESRHIKTATSAVGAARRPHELTPRSRAELLLEEKAILLCLSALAHRPERPRHLVRPEHERIRLPRARAAELRQVRELPHGPVVTRVVRGHDIDLLL